jgi:predicted nucleotidyltransferase
MPGPTVYPELNGVLDEFVASVRAILGENFCGAYLQGSFALGDADEHSDVDFIVATHHEVSDTQLAKLQAIHERLYGLESPWAQHLEGSYVPRLEFVTSTRHARRTGTWTTARPSSSATTTATRRSCAGHCVSTASCLPGRTRNALSSPCPGRSSGTTCDGRSESGSTG